MEKENFEQRQEIIIEPELRKEIRNAFMNVLRNLITRNEKWSKGFGIVSLLKDMEENGAPMRIAPGDRVLGDSLDHILANHGMSDGPKYNLFFEEVYQASKDYYEVHKEEIEDESKRNKEWVRQNQVEHNKPINKLKRFFGSKQETSEWDPDWHSGDGEKKE